MNDPTYVQMSVEVEYDRALVSDRHNDAIQAIMRKAAREVVAKVALLSNPDIVTLRAIEWDSAAATHKDMTLDD